VKVRYTRRAFRQMNTVLDYIVKRSPRGADNVKIRLQAAIELLADHPQSGRVTNAAGLRRIVANPYPYVIFYQPTATEIVIHSVRHAARRQRLTRGLTHT
jgi:toxin ParE1/3/4